LTEEGEAAGDDWHVHPSDFQGAVHGQAELPGDGDDEEGEEDGAG